MTIFHVLTHSDIDIYNEEKLSVLPSHILCEWRKDIQYCAAELLKAHSHIVTELPLIEDAIKVIECYLEEEISISDLEEGVRSITKDTLRDYMIADTDINKITANFIWEITFAITGCKMDFLHDAFMSANELDFRFSINELDVYFRNRLLKLLSEYDK